MKGKGHLIVIGVLCLALIASLAIGIFLSRNQPVTVADGLPPVAADSIHSEDFASKYPLQYESMKNTLTVDTKEDYAETGGKYGGAFYKSTHFEMQPYLPTLFAGYGFALEYNEERGHEYTLEDVGSIVSNRTKSGASCTYCKSSSIPGLLEEYGEAYYSLPFDEAYAMLDEAISCSDCHEPTTMDLRVTRPAVIRAWEALTGREIESATQQEMRSLVCGQCHVEYYFAEETKVVTFPWDNGEKAEAVYDYYEEIGFTDWVHEETGTNMLKAQHPDFELFMGSTHESAGVSCADCHMPYMSSGNQKYSSHWLTSPLKTMEQSCLQCHRQTKEELLDRVIAIQDACFEVQDLAGRTIEEAIAEIVAAQEQPNANQAKLDEAREYHREAQFYWDWVAAENSRGFHNPEYVENLMAKSVDLAHQAIQAARESYLGETAANYMPSVYNPETGTVEKVASLDDVAEAGA